MTDPKDFPDMSDAPVNNGYSERDWEEVRNVIFTAPEEDEEDFDFHPDNKI